MCVRLKRALRVVNQPQTINEQAKPSEWQHFFWEPPLTAHPLSMSDRGSYFMGRSLNRNKAKAIGRTCRNDNEANKTRHPSLEANGLLVDHATPRQSPRPCAQCGTLAETVWLRDKKIGGEVLLEVSFCDAACLRDWQFTDGGIAETAHRPAQSRTRRSERARCRARTRN
jgi:hypothetical protein